MRPAWPTTLGLNEVRPGRPEQFGDYIFNEVNWGGVSMKSGLEDRNNHRPGRSGRDQPVQSQ